MEQRQFIDTATGSPKLNWIRTKQSLQLLLTHHRSNMAAIKHEELDN